MPRRLSAAAVAQKWMQRTSAAGDAMKAGVMGVTESPTAKAADAKDRWVAGIQAAAADGRYEDGLRAVSLSDWQRSMTEKGVQNMQNGVRLATDKMQKFMQEFLPAAQASSEECRAMPKGTDQDSINRMTKNFENMKAFGRRRAR